jgi:hypothetical protein
MNNNINENKLIETYIEVSEKEGQLIEKEAFQTYLLSQVNKEIVYYEDVQNQINQILDIKDFSQWLVKQVLLKSVYYGLSMLQYNDIESDDNDDIISCFNRIKHDENLTFPFTESGLEKCKNNQSKFYNYISKMVFQDIPLLKMIFSEIFNSEDFESFINNNKLSETVIKVFKIVYKIILKGEITSEFENKQDIGIAVEYEFFFKPQVIIIRGIPGSGKSTMIKKLLASRLLPDGELEESLNKAVEICSADHYFINNESGEYVFVPENIGKAHGYCQIKFIEALHRKVPTIFVDNTNIKKEHYQFYIDNAIKEGYNVQTVHPKNMDELLDNIHDSSFVENKIEEFYERNVHQVPLTTIKSMLNSWEEEEEA